MATEKDRGDTVEDLLKHGLLKHNERRWAEAEQAYRAILERDPFHADALHLLGLLAREHGHFDEGIAKINAAIAINPNSAVFFCNLGQCYLSRLERPAAELCYRKALAIDPDYADAANNLAWLLLERQQYEQALTLLNETLSKAPRHERALLNLGRLHFERQKYRDALACFDRALADRPRSGMAMMGRLSSLYELNRFDEALELADRIPGLAPSSASEALAKKGEILMGLGRIDEARKAFDAGLAADPTHVELLYARSQVLKAEPGDPYVAELPRISRKVSSLGGKQRAQLCYALGKISADLGDMESAARHYAMGATAMLQQSTIAEDAAKQFHATLMSGCTRPYLDALRRSGDERARPIFILGMMRSGTTLTEQFLARHPAVFAAGELKFMTAALDKFPLPSGLIDNGTGEPGVTEETSFGVRAELYLAKASALPGLADKPCFTDKLPSNFHFLGLIWAMYPNAKIVHCRRDPIDTCISNYTTLLTGNAFWSYDFGHLGRYYRRYHDLMEHWRRILPGQFLELRYEQTIDDPEGAARKLLDWCGLDWDDRVLDFHAADRVIRTPSVAQVRQPIYRSSVGRWKKWEPYIGALLDEIGDLEDAYRQETAV